MSNIDKSAGAAEAAQARYIAQKRTELQDQESAIVRERGQAERNRNRAAAAENEKTQRELVEISKAGEQQLEAQRKLNSDRVHSMSENQQKTYQNLAATTAKQIQTMEGEALRAVNEHRESTTEHLRFVTDQTEDPFYRLKTLNPVIREAKDEYSIHVGLPEHEARNLMIAGEGQTIKLTLARRFQEKTTAPTKDATTSTSSYQTITEALLMPGAFNARKITRDYADGVVTIHVPKAGLFNLEGQA